MAQHHYPFFFFILSKAIDCLVGLLSNYVSARLMGE